MSSSDAQTGRPSLLRRLWIALRHNGACPCSHDHGTALSPCPFCFWCVKEGKR